MYICIRIYAHVYVCMCIYIYIYVYVCWMSFFLGRSEASLTISIMDMSCIVYLLL